VKAPACFPLTSRALLFADQRISPFDLVRQAVDDEPRFARLGVQTRAAAEDYCHRWTMHQLESYSRQIRRRRNQLSDETSDQLKELGSLIAGEWRELAAEAGELPFSSLSLPQCTKALRELGREHGREPQRPELRSRPSSLAATTRRVLAFPA
jgi:hypothetical protein